jgi:hypothetical protein
MCMVRIGALGLLLAVAPGAVASPPPAPESSSPPAAGEGELETARRSVRSATEWLARGVDSWFGDRPFKDGGKVTDGALSASLSRNQDEGTHSSLHFNARVRLPNIERQTYLFFGRDNEREAVTDTPTELSRQQRLIPETREQTSLVAGVAVSTVDAVDLRLGVRGGLKPYAQARYRQFWEFGAADRVDFRETLFWTLDDHVGSTTALSLERGISPTLAARWLTAATITQVTRKFEWTSNLGAYRSLGAQRTLSLEALVSGGQAPGVGISDVGLQVRWEQPIHKDWLLGDIVVGRFWPRQDAASDAIRGWALGCGVKMLF